MKKIPTLYVRNQHRPSEVTRDVTPGCEWVIHGEGVATLKLDGTCCRIRRERGVDQVLYRRRTLRIEKNVAPEDQVRQAINDGPAGFLYEYHDLSKVYGWEPCIRGQPGDEYHWEAFDRQPMLQSGTYELMGPKVQGNPEGRIVHSLEPHGAVVLADCPRTWEGLNQYLRQRAIEGVVWHHEDGVRKAKIKRRDFGWPWPAKPTR